MVKNLILISLIIFFQKANAQGETIHKIDSVVYSKNDAFFEYTIFDAFLGTDDSIYHHELSKDIIQRRKLLTQIGQLKKSSIYQAQKDSIFEFINKEGFASMKIADPHIISDKVTVTTKYYSNGKLVNVISDYAADGNEELIELYNQLDNTIKNIEHWELWKLDKEFDLVNWEQLDSVEIVKHDKSGENYYRNGVKKSVVLIGEDLKKVVCYLKQADQYVPYSKERYSVLTGRTDKYSLIFYLNDGKFTYKYDGKRIMKTSYLHYTTKKNIAKKFL